jgi:hypothetical protein
MRVDKLHLTYSAAARSGPMRRLFNPLEQAGFGWEVQTSLHDADVGINRLL